MTDAALASAGFSTPAYDTARSFRRILQALSRPGLIVDYTFDIKPSPPLTPTLAGILLTLADADTQLWLDKSFRSPASDQWLRFHTGARIADCPTGATFAIGRADTLVSCEKQFAYGTAEYPDQSTTLIAVVDGFERGRPVLLEGPGNAEPRRFSAAVDPALWCLLQVNAELFPLGLDCVFAAPAAIAAVPRSTIITFPGDV